VIKNALYYLVTRCARADGVQNYFDVGGVGHSVSVRLDIAGALGGRMLHPLTDDEANPQLGVCNASMLLE
jgi:hypothetical protein